MKKEIGETKPLKKLTELKRIETLENKFNKNIQVQLEFNGNQSKVNRQLLSNAKKVNEDLMLLYFSVFTIIIAIAILMRKLS